LEVETLYREIEEKMVFVDEEFKKLFQAEVRRSLEEVGRIKFNELVEKVLKQPELVKDFLENYQLTLLEKEILKLITNYELINHELAPYKYHILHKIKTLKYLLSEKEEQLLTKVSSVDSQVENLYDEFHNGLTFPIFLN
jgi:oligoendopeptidase F